MMNFKSPLLYVLNSLTTTSASSSDSQPVVTREGATLTFEENEKLQLLLQQYNEIFQEPHELPPFWRYNYIIPLLPHTQPVNITPYRYPHYQKAEIDKLAADMLSSSIIQPSTSPYSSPVFKDWDSHLLHLDEVFQWPIAVSVKELRSFLGLTGYYRKFEAFETLRRAMAEAPVLVLPDFSLPFVIETDASSWGMGVVLQQQGHPLAYISKAFRPRSKALSVYERELLAITFAVTKKSVENKAADALSRRPDRNGQSATLSCCPLQSTKLSTWMTNLIHSYVGDSKATTVIQQVSLHNSAVDGYQLKQGVLYYHNRLYVGSSTDLRHSLKLSPKYYGPYQIIAKYGTIAYKLVLPPTSSIHPIFHVSMLKKKLGNNVTPLVDLPTMNEEQVVVAPEQVLQTRTITRDQQTVLQGLIKW
ncbi:uncharacterized protein LOC131183242 [Hevea brasiliensis]|uniref:uncharacterized protein LOC131183242 n=1 Tax=Hevea brasiliensis TaxID=3981 RepID=UPI0025D1C122|nr:uncharacterized protein LOC131183242 [Hevea brasiliensis]